MMCSMTKLPLRLQDLELNQFKTAAQCGCSCSDTILGDTILVDRYPLVDQEDSPVKLIMDGKNLNCEIIPENFEKAVHSGRFG